MYNLRWFKETFIEASSILWFFSELYFFFRKSRNASVKVTSNQLKLYTICFSDIFHLQTNWQFSLLMLAKILMMIGSKTNSKAARDIGTCPIRILPRFTAESICTHPFNLTFVTWQRKWYIMTCSSKSEQQMFISTVFDENVKLKNYEYILRREYFIPKKN